MTLTFSGEYILLLFQTPRNVLMAGGSKKEKIICRRIGEGQLFIVKNRKAAEKKKKFEKVIKRIESDRLRYQAKKEAK